MLIPKKDRKEIYKYLFKGALLDVQSMLDRVGGRLRAPELSAPG